MERRMSATQARARFGALMQQVVDSQQPIIVGRRGKPQVVILSVAEYERLRAFQDSEEWRESLKRVIKVGARIKARKRGQSLSPPAEVIRQVREKRDTSAETPRR
jgi:prevent-host-death family protein